jgi:hypothetical protein
MQNIARKLVEEMREEIAAHAKQFVSPSVDATTVVLIVLVGLMVCAVGEGLSESLTNVWVGSNRGDVIITAWVGRRVVP